MSLRELYERNNLTFFNLQTVNTETFKIPKIKKKNMKRLQSYM